MPSFAAPQGLGLNTASTTYGDGGATTRTTGMGMPGGNDDLLNFFKELARRRMAPPTAAPTPKRPHVGGRGLHHPPPVQGPDTFREFADRQHTLHQLSSEVDDNTPAAYGRRMMNDHGQFGFQVDPTRVPAALADKIHGGFYGDMTNWDSSNPQLAGERSGWGEAPRGGGYMPAGPQEASANPAIDDDSWRRQAFLSQNPYASGLMNKFQVQD